MTPTEVTPEMTALDVFCAEKVMKWERIDCSPEDLLQGFFCICDDHIWIQTNDGLTVFSPTQSQHDAFEVLKRGGGRLAFGIGVQQTPEGWAVCFKIDDRMNTEAPTLELAIAKFAQKLFSK